ncbi:alpha/beta hydrolase domain-containing protein [Solimonas terrae]|uniref:Alpha/beta hydrolase domain-containing protein n=1 Tax=Solimonas terrae TaxID=1396819 RepID=A0A6M2BRJ4_9GAMM|nr:alpha/beta hydrolase domain-containing protein [Solimonas terrae]NGY04950.1 hypothetical protein [Solimonas terrae]
MNRNASLRLLLCVPALALLAGCGSSEAPGVGGGTSAGEAITYPDPVVEKVQGLDDPFVAGTTFPLADVGYERHEYFYSGTARSYVNDAPLDPDGNWQVSPADSASYKTRMLVYQPSDATRFNGTVILEWLNDSGGVDTAADWVMLHNELIRGGYVWVGISAQKIGIDGGIPPASPLPIAIPLKLINPLRYASLSHPGDSFSYDIYAQGAQALRHPQGVSPLGGLQLQRLIATGESQSATRLTTFINAFGPRTDLFDGYFIHSRLGFIPDFGGASAPLSQTPQADITTPDVVRFRTDLARPVMDFQTETDLFVLGAYSSRQADSRYFRLWEVPGAAHADTYLTNDGFTDEGGDVATAQVYETKKPGPVGSCPEPINSAPQHHFVAQAAMRALNAWLVDGIAPPKAPRMQVNAAGDGVLRDANGNALGGIRSPYLDVPTAVLSGENSSTQDDGGICFLVGKTALFDTATLQSLYADHDHYVAAVRSAAQDAVDKGFLLDEDATLIETAAEQSSVP